MCKSLLIIDRDGNPLAVQSAHVARFYDFRIGFVSIWTTVELVSMSTASRGRAESSPKTWRIQREDSGDGWYTDIARDEEQQH